MGTAWAYRALATRFPKIAANRALWTAVACLGFAGFYLALHQAFEHRGEPNWGVEWKLYSRPELVFAFVPATLGSLFAFPAWQRVLANPFLVFLSYISYNLYMWHQALAWKLQDWRLPGWVGSDPHADHAWPLPFTLLAFAFAIVVAWLLTTLVERPLLRGRPFQSFFAGGRPVRANAVVRALPEPVGGGGVA
jgi:peptidoglycan/LPS O-acetylase OafA/YrhL